MNDKKDAGYIIIVVSVILVALSLMGMVFINLTSIDFTATDNYVNNLQAEKAASAGLEYAIYVLKMDKYGTDSIVYNNDGYRYYGTTTRGYDENYDAYTEEWLGTGTSKIFWGTATDNNADGTTDSKWIDAPFSLDRGLKAQYAILIEDVGESRINVNATGNVVGTTGSFVYGTGATTYDIRLQDILTGSITTNVIGTNTGRCGANGTPGSTGTSASQFQPRNPSGDDRPFNVLDAADICFGTCTSSTLYKSRLRNIINDETLFQSVRGSLTAYSFDSIITNNGIIGLLLPDNKNYYRLNINTASADDLSAQMRHCVFGTETLMADQIAAHIIDYRDTDDTITVYNSKYGLEAHPYINELFYATATSYHRIELINPFNRSIDIGGWKLEINRGGTTTTYTLGSATIGTATASNPVYFALGDNPAVATLTTNLIVSALNIYDYDADGIPIAVTVTLRRQAEDSNYVIVDQAYPSAYVNILDIVGLVDALIASVYACDVSPDNALIQKLEAAKDELEETPPDCENAEDKLENFENQVEALEGHTSPPWKACISANADEFISRAEYIMDVCENPPSALASIGQRKIPIIERSSNWTGSSTNHTIGAANSSFNNIRQLIIANKDIISLGELGRLMTIGYNTTYSYTLDASYATSTNYVDNAKMNLFGGTFTTMPDYFTVLDPKNDSIDDDADGAIGTDDTGTQSGDIDGPEIQVAGRININTAPSTVLSALPGTSTNTSLGIWSTMTGNTLINNIINARPYNSIGTITSVSGMNYFATDNTDNNGDEFVDDKYEKDLIFTSISNLITTHTNVFAVYVTARIVNSNASQTFAEKKLVAIVDRSATPIKIRYFRWMTEW